MRLITTPPVPAAVRDALTAIVPGGGPGDPDIDQDWGDPALTPVERAIAGNTLEVLSLAAGHPGTPVNAIPGAAHAHCQLRFVVGTSAAGAGGAGIVPAIRARLDQHGFGMVSVEPDHVMGASRTDPADPWVRFALDSLERTEGAAPGRLPKLGGSLPGEDPRPGFALRPGK